MAAGPKLRARTNYITALMPPLTTMQKKLEFGSNCSQLKRPCTAKPQKQSSQTSGNPLVNYSHLKKDRSLITIDRILVGSLKLHQKNNIEKEHDSKNSRPSCVSRVTDYRRPMSMFVQPKEDLGEYSDDWDSDYSDDWESDINEESSPNDLFQKRPVNTKRFVPADGDAFGTDFCSRRQAAIDNMAYRRAVGSWRAKALHEIVNLILRLSSGKSMIDRAWIVFYWVSQNIEYDVEAYFSGHIPRQTSEDVFASRKGVCDAFGTIFETLCAGVQLECKKICGYAKGYSFAVGQTSIPKSNHAWNVIRLEQHWYLVDSTWGTGHLDREKRNKKELDSYYFLARPEQMIYRHFPDDSRWQLLAPPITVQEFLNLPLVYPLYFKLDLEIVSPSNSNMASFNPKLGLAEVLIRAPSNAIFSTRIEHKEGKKNDADSFVQYDADQQLWQCLFAPYVGGMHTLTIFASRKTASQDNKTGGTTYSSAIQLGLQVPIDFLGNKTFPLTYGSFTEHKCQIIEPLGATLKPGSIVTMRCRIPGAHCVRLMLDTLWLTEELIKDDIFQRKLTVPKREIVLYVMFSDRKTSTTYHGLFKYTLK